ncbi:MAG TPA: tRNA (guanosine(46)-N7)-methyltransferase TrmB [Aeromicrobium sp.]|mgnify:FL=1|nr:tRNA (guanosine(46)-N7)-methyltransferase TrmB [Aeromicrobium sp.]
MPTEKTDASPAAQDDFRREVVSFTRRGGRLSERQQLAWDQVGDKFVIDIPRGRTSASVADGFTIDPSDLFGREAPLILEIGSGRGESLVHAAAENPDVNFLGLEVYVPGVAQTLIGLRNESLTNVRLAVVDAVPTLERVLPAESVDEVRLWFPDPWHKKRHNKRRLVVDSFTKLVHRVLKPGGTWRMATDWQDYADQMHEVLAAAEGFDYSGGWDERFAGRPITRFETKGLRVGREIRDLSATKIAP